MSVSLRRLGLGEWLLGVGSGLLLVDLFGATWFEYRPQYHSLAAMLGQRVGANGWQTFSVIGPLALVVCLAGLAAAWLAASRRSPALPAVLTTLVTPLAFVLGLLVAIRVLLAPPTVHLVQAGAANVIEPRPGAYIGLALSIAVFLGAFLSMRRDGVTPEDSPAAIQVLSVGESRTGSPA